MLALNQTVPEILAWNKGRNPALLELKWTKIASDPFTFFRGTAPLFYQVWAEEKLPPAPRVWSCGDAHLENIGSYRGENRIPYFDLNDFDEACLAPAHWDVGRALTSLHLAGEARLAFPFLQAYLHTLASGKSSHIQPEVAKGPMAALLEKVQGRKRQVFLAERTEGKRLLIREGHSYALEPAIKKEALKQYLAWAKTQDDQHFYKPLDLCGRIAGNGSLGLQRYMVFIQGKKLPQILDMKEAISPAGKPYLISQPLWKNEAERVATVQRMMQYVPAAYLSFTRTKPVSFIIRALQPTDDRINIGRLDRKDYREFALAWAQLIASAHLRTASWNASAPLDALIAFGQTTTHTQCTRLLDAAERNAQRQNAMFKEFRKYWIAETEKTARGARR
jgi:uncharacterized protein (DUF2252 family)